VFHPLTMFGFVYTGVPGTDDQLLPWDIRDDWHS